MKAFLNSVLLALCCIVMFVSHAAEQKPASKQALVYQQQIFSIDGERYQIQLPVGYRLE